MLPRPLTRLFPLTVPVALDSAASRHLAELNQRLSTANADPIRQSLQITDALASEIARANRVELVWPRGARRDLLADLDARAPVPATEITCWLKLPRPLAREIQEIGSTLGATSLSHQIAMGLEIMTRIADAREQGARCERVTRAGVRGPLPLIVDADTARSPAEILALPAARPRAPRHTPGRRP